LFIRRISKKQVYIAKRDGTNIQSTLKQGKRFAIPLIKKKFLEVSYKLNLAKSQVKPKEHAYSRGIILHKALAPARHHKRASSLILLEINVAVEKWCRNILAFLSFHISQEISIAIEAMAFTGAPLLWIPSVHHSFTLAIPCQASTSIDVYALLFL
jgi:hypothetical protein